MAAPTPQRPLPGGFINTPAPPRQITQQRPPPAFRMPSNPGLQRSMQTQGTIPGTIPSTGTLAPAPGSQDPIVRAAGRMNQCLSLEQRFPALDDYITQGISSEYDVPESTSWAPFEQTRTFDIPDRIFEQLNDAHFYTKLGLFSEFHHAWATVDNVLYLWDYTHPNPELLGCDELSNPIISVRLAKPKPGVFRTEITNVLLISTSSEIAILGLSVMRSPDGVASVSLYQTDLRVPLKNLEATCLDASSKTGRVFFGGAISNDVYEITYQKEEKWFSNKCAKINHTSPDVMSAVKLPSIPFVSQLVSSVANVAVNEHVKQLVVDDTRDLLYVLSSKSTIRVFHMKEPGHLNQVITRKVADLMSNVLHMVPSGSLALFPKSQSIASVSPIPRNESNRLALLVTTVLGVRLYLSVTSGYSYYESSSIASSMQVHHIKFPPPPPPPPKGSSNTSGNTLQLPHYGSQALPLTDSPALTPTNTAHRYSPGFHFWVKKNDVLKVDELFISAPESGRIARVPETGTGSRFMESGQWQTLSGVAEDMGLVTQPFAAASTPAGFGNELAVQFDQPATEVAILTNTGVYVFRRRRLVDTFAAALRTCATEEDYENVIQSFVRNYSRTETVVCAFAVACGQALEGGSDGRVSALTDNEVVEYARRTVIEHGGKADIGDETATPSIDSVRPSPRAQALTIYATRIVRSAWKSAVIQTSSTPAGGLSIKPSVPIKKLQAMSLSLVALKEFLEKNKTYIPGLGGPEEMNRITSVSDRTVLSAEHQSLDAQLKTIANIIEGVAFLTQLFDQPVEEIVLSLVEADREKLKTLTFQELFTTAEGKAIAKELVKAIVNRSIAAGSNVDTVADALRRRCGSFCSADDVVIFKAQENLQKAVESGAESAAGRNQLNESLKLFEKVAGNLSTQYLQNAVERYVDMSFYAGAIQLCLTVAQQRDRANRALAWIKDGKPSPDNRQTLYTLRTDCYAQIWTIIERVDQIPILTNNETVAASLTRRKEEAYAVIDLSDDEVFQNCLFDYYLSKGSAQRLLELTNSFVVAYLQRRAVNEREQADLLWKYYAHHNEYFEAAKVQLQLAKSGFEIDLPTRIEYLSRAKANASTRMATFARLNGSKQEVIRDVSDQLDCASVQLDILRRLEGDDRLQDPNRTTVLTRLNGQVLSLDDLYHDYVSLAGYHDLSLIIYQLSDYRNSQDILATWHNWITSIDQEAGDAGIAEPHVVVEERVRALGRRVNCSETVFNPTIVVNVLLTWILVPTTPSSPQSTRGASTWPLELLLDLNVPYDSVLVALETVLFNESGWTNSRKRVVASLVVCVCIKWLAESGSSGLLVGGSEGAESVAEALRAVEESGLLAGTPDADMLRDGLEQVMRVL